MGEEKRSGRQGRQGGKGRRGHRRRRTWPVSEREQLAFRRNPFALTDVVYFETSNYCPRFRHHKFCPVHFVGFPPKHLSRRLFESGVRSLARYGYNRELRLHTLSEPLSDPRLFGLVRFARKTLPHAAVSVWTNGESLSQTLADELVEAGASIVVMSAYSRSERERLGALDIRCRSYLHNRIGFSDDTLFARYDGPELGSTEPCSAPLGKIQIGCDGRLAVCCRDWQRRHTFGRLADMPLERLLRQPAVWKTYVALRSGKRSLRICRRCAKWR